LLLLLLLRLAGTAVTTVTGSPAALLISLL